MRPVDNHLMNGVSHEEEADNLTTISVPSMKDRLIDRKANNESKINSSNVRVAQITIYVISIIAIVGLTYYCGYMNGGSNGYDRGYNRGHSIGYLEGQISGLDEGYQNGYNAGYAQSYADQIVRDNPGLFTYQ